MDGHEQVGLRVSVFWPQEDAWFDGTIIAFDRRKGFRVEYDDGDEEYLKSLDASHVRKLGDTQHGDDELMGPSELVAFHDDEGHWGEGQHTGVHDGSSSPLAASCDEGPLGLSVDNFSPLPVPRVDSLHRITEQRRQPEPGATIPEHEPWRQQEHSGGKGHPDRSYAIEADDGEEEGRIEDDDEGQNDDGSPLEASGLGEEVALLQGDVMRARSLPCSSPCFARVLYVESSGANVLFACKTTVHQTEVSLSDSLADPVWEHGSFRFELLAPIPGDPIKGELIFAVFELPTETGTTNFLGQAIIDLSSAADSQQKHQGGDRVVEGSFPLRTRKGTPLPSGEIYIRLQMRLPVPSRTPPVTDRQRPSAERRKVTPPVPATKNARASLAVKGIRGPRKPPSSSSGGGARKWHHATMRDKEKERIAKANKIHMDKLAKYKGGGGGGGSGSNKKNDEAPIGGGAQGEYGLTIEIPGQEREAKGVRSRQLPVKYTAEQLGSLQQEVAALKDRIKILGAKQGRLDRVSRRNKQLGRGVDKSSADENHEPNESQRQSGTGDAAAEGGEEEEGGQQEEEKDPIMQLGLASFSEDALSLLEERGSVHVQVYRDLLSRRRAWQSRTDTFKGEWKRSNEAIKAMEERIMEAEKARRLSQQKQQQQQAAGAGGKKKNNDTTQQEEEEKVYALQAKVQDLKVEIEALKTSRELRLANGDLEHEVRVLQASVEQTEEMTAEKRERLKTVQFDRDAYRDKQEAMVAGQLHEKLTTSVNALQLGLLVLSKEKDWTAIVEEGAEVHAEAEARGMVGAMAANKQAAAAAAN